MNSINFKQLEIYTDIAKTNKFDVDTRKDLSNILYNGSTGIVAHNLALKIYNSDGAIEITDEEGELLTTTVEKYCTPAFIEAIKTKLKKSEASDPTLDKDGFAITEAA